MLPTILPAQAQYPSLNLSLNRLIIASVAALLMTGTATAQNSQRGDNFFYPGNFVVSRSVYHNNPANVQVGTVLPPNCANTQGGCGASTGAPYDGTYPTVWNNDLYDASFGITARIFLDQISPSAP